MCPQAFFITHSARSRRRTRGIAGFQAIGTCTSTEFRDFTKALETAELACKLTDWKCHECLSILAAAYSEIGDFEQACKWQDKALALLLPRERSIWEWDYTMRRELYQSDMSYHEGYLWSFSNGKLEGLWTINKEDNATLADESGNGLDGKLMGLVQKPSIVAVAEILGVSSRTAERYWAFTKTWLIQRNLWRKREISLIAYRRLSLW